MRKIGANIMKEGLYTRIRNAEIVSVIKLEDPLKAISLGKALCAGGIRVAEVTFTTASAAQSIAQMNDKLPDMLIGTGTVLTAVQAKAAREAGAHFIVSPGFNELHSSWWDESLKYWSICK